MDDLLHLSDLCSQDIFSEYDDNFASQQCIEKYEQHCDASENLTWKNINSGKYVFLLYEPSGTFIMSMLITSSHVRC